MRCSGGWVAVVAEVLGLASAGSTAFSAAAVSPVRKRAGARQAGPMVQVVGRPRPAPSIVRSASLAVIIRCCAWRVRMPARTGLLGLIALATVIGATFVTPPASASLVWTKPTLIDHKAPFGYQGALLSLACPSSTLCVAGDADGNVATSHDPTNPSSWRVTRVDDAGDLRYSDTNAVVALSCPSASLCVGVDGLTGDVLVSRSPARGAHDWKVLHVAPNQDELLAVSCPSRSFCVAMTSEGDVLISTRPAGSARDWRLSHVSGGGVISAVTCASTALCLAVDDRGDVLTSTNPVAGGKTWHVRHVDGSNIMFAIACPDVTLCLAGDGSGNILADREPASPTSAWTPANIDSTRIVQAIACRSAMECAAIDDSGTVLASTNPAGGPQAWGVVGHDPHASDSGYDAVACPSVSLCVAVDGTSSILASSQPAVPGTWSAMVEDQSTAFTGVSCPSTSMCVAVDTAGNVVSSTHPRRPGSWRISHVDQVALDGVSCPSLTLCVAVDAGGDVVTSTNPTGGPRAWKVTNLEPPYTDRYGNPATVFMQYVSCASASFCAVGGADEFGSGINLVSTSPTGPRQSWKTARGLSDVAFNGVSCVSKSLCVGVADTSVTSTTRPALGGGTSFDVGGADLTAVTCGANSLCLAADGATGAIVRITRPGSAHPRWQGTAADKYGLLAISCRSTALCVAADGSGNILFSTDPAGRNPHWRSVDIDGRTVLLGVACPSPKMCVVIDNAGDVIVGTDRSRTG